MHNNGTSIEEDLAYLRSHILEYSSLLNREVVWLFIAIMACWSVTQPILQVIASLLSFGIFFSNFFSQLSDRRTFATLIRSAEGRIVSEIEDGDTRKARLYDLVQIRSNELARATSLRTNWVFFSCWLFSGACVAYFIACLFLNTKA